MLYSGRMAPERFAKPQRVFFALWPDATLRAPLADLALEVARESGGRPTARNLLHLTLAFLGDQPAAGVETLRGVGGRIRARAFALTFDTIGGFRRTGIAWLGAGAPQPELEALQGELATALRASGFVLDARPYAPHLTLARHCAVTPERRLPQPLCWRVSSFVLVESAPGRGGPEYRTLADWPLAAA